MYGSGWAVFVHRALGAGAGEPSAEEALRERRPSLDSAGTVTERVAAPGVLRHPVGTPADGAIALQSLVSLVRGAFARQPDLGSDHLHENRERLQNGEVFTKFMTKLLNHPQVKPLLSDEHFSVDGTLIEAWVSHKSF